MDGWMEQCCDWGIKSVFFMRVNEQETANEPAEWCEGGLMDGRGLKRQQSQRETSAHANARMNVSSICLF